MTSRPSRPRNHHLAMALAMLALFAQLWMVQLSTVHWGQMLSEQALFSDVCSAQIATHSGQTPDTSPANHTGGGWLNCPVCSAAAASFTPPSLPTAVAAIQEDAFYRIKIAPSVALTPRHANLRPPAQAPPAYA
ncbi:MULTISPECIES: DUF2946 family protein [unclassified Acidovorax]|uniref:DUF2946 family protein n=1 Tax=unclassified Acidovorax TaxID=2684926 RepID=UPI0012DE7062|nr:MULTISPECIES: DUF2946 family protein [unclassified Acidovorax]MCL5740728.1 hypothetical protein [Betaproteobacteria bacterium]HQS22120.1 hypothetical protein [Acidovorax defluvii]MBP7439777.1 hypothetical protein [Acidovorax sp.]MBP7960009.1 hypothetical protein [Acidovorax sp.]MBP8226295.1 hypothetical protein [Acidovorax sp.]